MENLSDRYGRRRGAVLVGLASSFDSFCLSPYQFKSCALADPELRRIWDIKVIQHPRINAAAHGLRVPLLIEQIERHCPELVCLTCESWSRAVVADVIPAMRQFLTPVQVVTVALGSRLWASGTGLASGAAGGLPEGIAADYFIGGDGEHVFVDLLRHLTAGEPGLEAIEGLARREAVTGEWRVRARRASAGGVLDIPPPYSTGAADDEVFARPGVQACIETWRAPQAVSREGVERALREVRYCLTKGVRAIRFVDADFAADPAHAKAVVRGLMREGLGASITCDVGAESVDAELTTLFEAYVRQQAGNAFIVRPVSMREVASQWLVSTLNAQ